MGFTGVEAADPGIPLSDRQLCPADADGRLQAPGLYAAGDCVMGPSLVCRAIAQGRRTALSIHADLGGKETWA